MREPEYGDFTQVNRTAEHMSSNGYTVGAITLIAIHTKQLANLKDIDGKHPLRKKDKKLHP